MTQYAHIVLSWLILSCYLFCPSLGRSNGTVKCIDKERKALLQFKAGIFDWNFCNLLASWREGSDCCQWHGVHCDNYTGHVIMLRLLGTDSSPCIEGDLGSSLGQLKYLRHLNLKFNVFTQPTVLDFLGSLTSLDYLNLAQSSVFDEILPDIFSSEILKQQAFKIPDRVSLQWLSRLKLLRYLDLSGFFLDGDENWLQIVSLLPLLGVFRMDSCQLPQINSSSISHNNSSSNLRVISLSGNQINDIYIFQWLFSLPRIAYLDLSLNSLKGPIPIGFKNLRHLSHLDLSNNYFEGHITEEFQNMHTLSYLSFHKNNLQGSVVEICSSLCNLQQLYLGFNNFSDDLSHVIEALYSCENTELTILDLSRNRFWGGVPDLISSFSLLKELYLDGNQLNGTISPGIGKLGMLEKLDISSNSFKATITHTHFLNLSRLSELYISNNPKTVIKIDANWEPPFQLDIISLRSCTLGPYFPNWLQTQTKLSYLDVSDAKISDEIPVSFWRSLNSNLIFVGMSHNQIHGSIPSLSEYDEKMSGLLDLSSNLFEGVIPSWLVGVQSLNLNDNRFSDSSNIFCPDTMMFANILSEVDLANNLLSGELSDCWMSFEWLSILHLEYNRFSGNIPKSIGNLNNLETLNLQNNSFSGQIPPSLMNCTSLRVLNLANNLFTERIPPWISNFDLIVLILRRNNFVGEIPASVCKLPSLQILDLAINRISGRIPSCINNLKGMTKDMIIITGMLNSHGNYTIGRLHFSTEVDSSAVTWKRKELNFKDSLMFVKYIDLSFNELDGEIPDGLFNLVGLESLALSDNNLNGSISTKMGQLRDLELLDLSSNNLTSVIPTSLVELNSLAILNLSNNNLFGRIPLGTQLQSFTVSSYSGNSGLCGDPLPKCHRDQSPVNALNGDNTSVVQDEHDNYGLFPGLYIAVVLGFITGFWGVFGSLLVKTSWRHAWFQLLNDIRDKFYVIRVSITAKFYGN